jgi:hypothetical protein
MSVLLENQAAQLLRETNTLGTSAGAASGDIRGFQNIAFPIVRRVFGGLVANELVSIQPMSLPSGLLFYLDYTYGSDVGGTSGTSSDSETYQAGQSIYNNPAGVGVRSGSLGVGGQYDLAGSGFSRRHSSIGNITGAGTATSCEVGIFADDGTWAKLATAGGDQRITSSAQITGTNGRFLQFDQQIATALDNGTI